MTSSTTSTTASRSSSRTRLACLLGAVLVAVPVTAQAAPKGTDRYPVSYGWRHSSCTSGATCTSAGSATRTGGLSGSSRYDLPVAQDGTEHEATHAGATHGLSLSVPDGASSITVTATWQLDVKDVAAAARTGTAYGLVGVRVDVPQCAGGGTTPTCTTTAASPSTVRRVYDLPYRRAAGLGPFSDGRDGVQTVTASVTVTSEQGGQLPGKLSVYPQVWATAGAYPDCLVRLTAGCEEELKADHSGTSSAAFSGTLQGVHLQVV